MFHSHTAFIQKLIIQFFKVKFSNVVFCAEFHFALISTDVWVYILKLKFRNFANTSAAWFLQNFLGLCIWPVKKLSGEVLAWLFIWSEVQMICIWSSWCHCHPVISYVCTNCWAVTAGGTACSPTHTLYLIYQLFPCFIRDNSER